MILMKRRMFLLGAGASLTTHSGFATAAPSTRVVILSLAAPKDQMIAFEDGLTSRGWVQGSTIDLIHKTADGRREAIQRLATEAVSLSPEVIVAVGTVAATAAQEATKDIPIVAVTGDMASAGLVENFSQPEGNLTGFSFFTTELTVKRLELLLQINPSLRHLKIMIPAKKHRTEVQTIATLSALLDKHGIDAELLEITSADDVEATIAGISAASGESLLVNPSVMIDGRAREIGNLTAKHGVVALLPWKEYVEGGGLMSYSPDIIAIWRNASSYVDRILRGAEPSELPVTLPTKFELVHQLAFGTSSRSHRANDPPTKGRSRNRVRMLVSRCWQA